MKKLFLTTYIACSLFFCSCNWYVIQFLFGEHHNPYEIPPFSTKYTVEEHIQRLKERTEEVFEWEIYFDEIVGYKVDIVYSLAYDLPEFFVVEIEYTEEKEYDRTNFWLGAGKKYPDEYRPYKTQYTHLIGYIEEDEYYSDYVNKSVSNPRKLKDELLPGRSPYSYKNCWDKKKYYGEMYFAVEIDGVKKLLFHPEECNNYTDIEYHIHWSEETGLTECTAGGIVPDDLKPYRSARYPYNGLVYKKGVQ